MKLFNAIAILSLGVLIGYTLPFFSNERQDSSDKRTHNIEKKHSSENYNDLAVAKKAEASITKQISCPPQYSQLSKDEINALSEVTTTVKIDPDLEQKYKMLEQELQQSKQKIKFLKRQAGELDASDVSDKELIAFIPKDYENLVVNYRGQTRDEIFEFHQQPEDLDKGFDLSHNISSFIIGHAYSFGVNLNSVICKKSNCELLINEKERPSWDRIYHDMIKQEWWKFNLMNSSSSTDEEGNIFIYYFMSSQSTE